MRRNYVIIKFSDIILMFFNVFSCGSANLPSCNLQHDAFIPNETNLGQTGKFYMWFTFKTFCSCVETSFFLWKSFFYCTILTHRTVCPLFLGATQGAPIECTLYHEDHFETRLIVGLPGGVHVHPRDLFMRPNFFYL